MAKKKNDPIFLIDNGFESLFFRKGKCNEADLATLATGLLWMFKGKEFIDAFDIEVLFYGASEVGIIDVPVKQITNVFFLRIETTDIIPEEDDVDDDNLGFDPETYEYVDWSEAENV